MDCPAPGLVDAEPDLTAAAGDPGCDVQDPVAERGDLTPGQLGGVGEADEFGPAGQVDRGEYDLEPGDVLVPCPARQVPQTGGFSLPDPVLDPGVLAVAKFQPSSLAGHHTGWGVGQERCDTHPVSICERQLRPGVGAFLA